MATFLEEITFFGDVFLRGENLRFPPTSIHPRLAPLREKSYCWSTQMIIIMEIQKSPYLRDNELTTFDETLNCLTSWFGCCLFQPQHCVYYDDTTSYGGTARHNVSATLPSVPLDCLCIWSPALLYCPQIHAGKILCWGGAWRVVPLRPSPFSLHSTPLRSSFFFSSSSPTESCDDSVAPLFSTLSVCLYVFSSR